MTLCQPQSIADEVAQAVRIIATARYTVARRLPELEVARKVRKGGQRECGIGGRLACEWWPT